MLNKNKQRLLAIIILLIVCLTPITAYAHDAVFLQVGIDKNSMTYVGNVIVDKASATNTPSKHIEAQLGDFSNIKITDNSENIITGDSKVAEIEGAEPSKTDGKNGMVFTFPSMEVKDYSKKWFLGETNNATRADTERALLISNLLIPSLNEALIILNYGMPYNSVDSLIAMSQDMRTEGKVGATDYSIHYGTYSGTKFDKINPNKDYDYDPDTGYLYATIYKGENIASATEKYRFVYAVPKGYVEPNFPGYSNKSERERMKVAPLAFGNVDYSRVQPKRTGVYDDDVIGKNNTISDTVFLSWHQLTIQANYAYASQGFTSDNTGEFQEPGFIEQGIIDFLDHTFNGLRSMLGLYSTEDLVYNQGTRGTFVYGTMSKQWNRTVVEYHLLFQAIAWLILSFAIAKAIVMKNLSTVSPTVRVDTMEFIQKLLISGFLLVNVFSVMYMLMEINTQLVDLFASQIDNIGSTTSMHTMYSSPVAGMIMTVFYFFIDLYMNFTYIMRGLTIALLLASSPLFIVSLAFGGRFTELFGTWMKEMIANIFLQSFHAFCFAFFTAIQSKTRGIEGFVVLSAMIPMTEFFRSLVTGNQGAFVQNFGSTTLGNVVSMASGAMASRQQRRVAGGKDGQGAGFAGDGEGTSNYKSYGGNNTPPPPDGGGGGSSGNAIRYNDMKDSIEYNRNNPRLTASVSKRRIGNNSSSGVEVAQAIENKQPERLSANTNRIKASSALKGAGKVAIGGAKTIGALGAGLATGNDKMYKMAGQGMAGAVTEAVGSKKIVANSIGNNATLDYSAKVQELQKIIEHDMTADTAVDSSTEPNYPGQNEAFADTQYPDYQQRIYNTDYMKENYPGDYKNITDMQQTFEGNNEIKKTQLKKAGIINAKSHENSKFISVQYSNAVAQQHLGKSGRSINVEQQIQQAQYKQQQRPAKKSYVRGMDNVIQFY